LLDAQAYNMAIKITITTGSALEYYSQHFIFHGAYEWALKLECFSLPSLLSLECNVTL